MAKYRIPEQYRNGFKVISGISDEQATVFSNAINTVSDAHSVNSFIDAVKDKVTIPYDDLKDLISTLFSLVSLVVEAQVTPEELASDMADSYDAFTDSERSHFGPNLIKLINGSSKIKLIIKARRLTNDYDKVFAESWILSDVRFVLSDNIHNNSQSAIIVHQLKVEYMQNGELSRTFFAMDNNDLQKLKMNIERALEKDINIRSGQYFDNLNFLELSN